jgi:hypothetical protein
MGMKESTVKEFETEIRPVDRWARNEDAQEVLVRSLVHPSLRAQTALELVTKWGMVACTTNAGEDTSGRQRLELLGPAEVVHRACSTADMAWDEFERRGWLSTLPGQDEIKAAGDAHRAAEDAKETRK